MNLQHYKHRRLSESFCLGYRSLDSILKGVHSRMPIGTVNGYSLVYSRDARWCQQRLDVLTREKVYSAYQWEGIVTAPPYILNH